jgi:hypothetical protein
MSRDTLGESFARRTIDPRINIIAEYSQISASILKAIDTKARNYYNFGVELTDKQKVRKVLIALDDTALTELMHLIKKENIQKVRDVQ